ncbi:MAG: hypothetical protein AAGJ50_13635 [Pseudomonadota bacterium]
MGAIALVTPELVEPVSLAEGIKRLEEGGPRPGLQVDLGNGNIAMASGKLGQAGLLQRLLGHRLLAAIAKDPPTTALKLPPRTVSVDPSAKELLDLVRPVG